MGMAMQATLIGVIATIGMDIWATIVNYVLRRSNNWDMVGRWFGHMPRGVFVHHPISESSEIRHERAIGWTAHYVTGIVYGFLYLYIVQVFLSSTPSLVSALVFGLVTLVAPWFMMQPAMGMGVFATRAPRPGLTRLINLSMHLVFGASLFLGWLLIK
jgi:hypothetical protein